MGYARRHGRGRAARHPGRLQARAARLLRALPARARLPHQPGHLWHPRHLRRHHGRPHAAHHARRAQHGALPSVPNMDARGGVATLRPAAAQDLEGVEGLRQPETQTAKALQQPPPRLPRPRHPDRAARRAGLRPSAAAQDRRLRLQLLGRLRQRAAHRLLGGGDHLPRGRLRGRGRPAVRRPLPRLQDAQCRRRLHRQQSHPWLHVHAGHRGVRAHPRHPHRRRPHCGQLHDDLHRGPLRLHGLRLALRRAQDTLPPRHPRSAAPNRPQHTGYHYHGQRGPPGLLGRGRPHGGGGDGRAQE
mmetsp:Transcript_30155/g.71029  ORF Transcript_30155/g.71029 Transcript_30155/m.71029 type:complete len:302 (+) Transcript_30155:418-1323(+)